MFCSNWRGKNQCKNNRFSLKVKCHSNAGFGKWLLLVNRICQGYQWQLESYIRANWFYLTITFSIALDD